MSEGNDLFEFTELTDQTFNDAISQNHLDNTKITAGEKAKKKKTEKHINNQLDFHECYYISTQKGRSQNNNPVVIANKGHSQ